MPSPARVMESPLGSDNATIYNTNSLNGNSYLSLTSNISVLTLTLTRPELGLAEFRASAGQRPSP